MEVVGERPPPPPLPPKSRMSHLENFHSELPLKQSIAVRGEGTAKKDAMKGFCLQRDYPEDYVNRGISSLILARESFIAAAKQEEPVQVYQSLPAATVTGSHFSDKCSRGLSKFVCSTNSHIRDRAFEAPAKMSPASSEITGPKIVTWAQKNSESENCAKPADSFLSINSRYRSDDPEKDEDFLYQNVSNAGTNYIEYKLNGIISKGREESNGTTRNDQNQSGTLKCKDRSGVSSPLNSFRKSVNSRHSTGNRQIEVRQIKNKTVVKISIKDSSAENWSNVSKCQFRPVKADQKGCTEHEDPEEAFSPAPECRVPTAKGSRPSAGGSTYLTCCRKQGDANEMDYANLLGKDLRQDDSSGDYKLSQEQMYANASDPECDQTYENQDFGTAKHGRVPQSEDSGPAMSGKAVDEVRDRQKPSGEEQIYENFTFGGKDEATYENFCASQNDGPRLTEELPTEKNFARAVEVPSPRSCVRVSVGGEEGRAQMEETNSFDYQVPASTRSEPQNGAQDNPRQRVKSKKIIVTISGPQSDKSESDDPRTRKNLMADGEKEARVGHGRAESLTSSGVGVDSEESDGDESNISCDSLNSNELNALSLSEDHGYHTPNSERKAAASPCDGADYQNVRVDGRISTGPVISGAYDGTKVLDGGGFVRGGGDGEIYENFPLFDQSGSQEKKFSPDLPPTPPPKPKSTAETVRGSTEADELKSLPKGLLRDIRCRSVRLTSASPKHEKRPQSECESHAARNAGNLGRGLEEFSTKSETRGSPAENKLDANVKGFKVEEKTYEERRKTGARSEGVSRICAMDVDTDQFYKFHLFENREEAGGEKSTTEEETFAGVKDYLSREKQAAIKSAKGTIRGVKNRVKAGIATFLQMQETKTYKDRDAGKIVVYSTTMGIVRETYHKCLKVKQILRTLMVKFEERDVFMSTEAQDEIRERMKCDAILVPQVFVEGQHIGDAETIERLNESGELRKILKPYKSVDACSTCQVCGGYRLLPCSICKGSKKSIHRNHFTAEFIALKCMNCDQVGLTKCYAC